MNKIICDGKVAVLVSSGYGAGWSTWNTVHSDSLLFDPDIVQMVLDRAPVLDSDGAREIADFAESRYNDEENTVYTGGADGLVVEWIPVGTRFMITEYDGHETVVTEHDLPLVA